MNILLVLNKPNRETLIMESIKREILLINHDAIIEIKEMCVPKFNSWVFNFKPDVILTFPFSGIGLSIWPYLFKVFLGVKIITLRTEGVVDFSSEFNIQTHVGQDNYGKNLVDYELFWGNKTANVIGEKLLQKHKLSSFDRVKVVGYPRLETYFPPKNLYRPRLPSRIIQKLNRYKKQEVVIFITGFHLANYTKQNLFDAKDLNAENMLDELLEAVEISKQFRAELVENIIISANENPNSLIVVKKHPIENREDYIEFSDVKNILFIYEDIQVDEVMPYVSTFFHCGSTALVDAYLTKIPTVYIYFNKSKTWYPDMGWRSSLKANVEALPEVVTKCLSGEVVFKISPDIKRVLKDIFNIKEGKSYRPSREIAKIILDNAPPQKVKITDPYFLKAVISIVYARTLGRFVNLLFKIKQQLKV
jgi:surface carbohydrate biosynthesis protein